MEVPGAGVVSQLEQRLARSLRKREEAKGAGRFYDAVCVIILELMVRAANEPSSAHAADRRDKLWQQHLGQTPRQVPANKHLKMFANIAVELADSMLRHWGLPSALFLLPVRALPALRALLECPQQCGHTRLMTQVMRLEVRPSVSSCPWRNYMLGRP